MATKKTVMESAAPASDKKKALETCMAQIERAYGKGSIMRLGENASVVVEAIPTGSLSLWTWPWVSAVSHGAVSLKSMDRSPPEKPLWLFTLWRKPKSGGARWLSSMQNMLWTLLMRRP